MKRNVLDSSGLSDLRKKRRKSFWNKLSLFVFCLLLIFSGLAYVSRLPKLNISDIKVSGNNIVDTDAIKAAADYELSGHYLHFFPKTNVFFYPSGNIKKHLLNEFTRLNKVDISIENGAVLKIAVSERAADYVWCGLAFPPATSVNQTCYFLDQDGFIFDQTPYFSGQVYLQFYGSTPVNGNGLPSGNYFIPKYFKNLINLNDTLTTMGLKTMAIYAEDDGDIEIILAPASGASAGPELLFEADADYQTVAENLQAALNTDPLKSGFQNKYASLQYIDLRFGNKVYYKFK